jgi:hypothetical protein
VMLGVVGVNLATLRRRAMEGSSKTWSGRCKGEH